MQEFEDFVARFGDQSNVIHIGKNLNELTGVGTEYLIQDGEIVAKFQDGDIVRATKPVDLQEDTITSA